jgi:hypothetical protein
LAGSSTPGYVDGQGTEARFYFSTAAGGLYWPYMAIDPSNQFLYVTDGGGIRRVDMDGTVTTVAPKPFLRHKFNGLSGTTYNTPAHGLDVDNKGDLYVVYQDPL